MSTSMIQIQDAGAVREVVLARPEKRNALNIAMYAELSGALEQAAAAPEVRVVLLRGEGPCYCAGNDLRDFVADPAAVGDAVRRLLRTLVGFGKPLVAAIHGPVTGIGATMLLHCDLVLAASGTQLSYPFVRLGLVPEGGSSCLLPRLIGHARAAELLLLSEPVATERASQLGLVNRVTTPDALLIEARAMAAELGNRPPSAVLATRRLMRGDQTELLAHIDEEMRVFAEHLAAAEFRTAADNFLRKRG